jgi:hypothetical protein
MERNDRIANSSLRIAWGRSLLAVLALVALASTGCMAPPITDSARAGPFFKPKNFTGDAMLPATFRRVVLLPVAGVGAGLLEPETALTFDTVLLTELQKKNRFEVVALSRAECLRRFGRDSFDSTSTLPHDFLVALQQQFAADGVLFVDVTSFRPYHPLLVGLRAKCVTIDWSHQVWSFDTVFSAADPTVANAARNYFLDSDRAGVPADMSYSVLQTPARFMGYVAFATFETLPPVYTAPVIKGVSR